MREHRRGLRFHGQRAHGGGADPAGGQHAAQSHGVKQVTPELADKVKAAIETR
jgi:hypothetical protein